MKARAAGAMSERAVTGLGSSPPLPPSMAHVAIARFCRKVFRPARRESVVEALVHAPSPFAVQGILDDFHRFATDASPKTRAQVLETARVRICELRGVLP